MKYTFFVFTSARVLLFLFAITTMGFSQDNIIMINGDEIKSKVVEIDEGKVKYKKFENLSGPTYVVPISEVLMIRYENGEKDIFNTSKQEEVVEPENNNGNKTYSNDTAPKEKYDYISKLREAQKDDPSFRIYAGNGWFLGPGYLNPVGGFDIRFARKNVFLRCVSLGLAVSFKNLEGEDYDNDDFTMVGTTVFGGVVALNYYAPIPLKKIQPYFAVKLGFGLFENQNFIFAANPYGSTSWNGVQGDKVGAGYDDWISFVGGAGLGCNFMLAKNFGFFLETGYFRTSIINTGLVVKI